MLTGGHDFEEREQLMAKKTKRKIAHPKLPMQRQLNLRHEGKYFDLRAIFEQLNQRYFRGRLRGYTVMNANDAVLFLDLVEDEIILWPVFAAASPHHGTG